MLVSRGMRTMGLLVLAVLTGACADHITQPSPIPVHALRVEELLQGKAPGIQVDRRAAPASVTIRLSCRNGGIPLAEKPLFVIDGTAIPYDETRCLMDALRPDDIDAIEILKGPAAVQRFGEPGAKGVVIMTMKPGTKLPPLPCTGTNP